MDQLTFRGETELLDEAREAMERAGRLLALRSRTERELRDRLDESGFGPDVVETTIARLLGLELIDDAAFAAQWIGERAARKGLGPRALRAELAAKGVESSIVDETLASAIPDEGARAAEVAAGLVRKVVRYPLEQQGRRIHTALVRKGFSHEAAEEGARAVLPPEGWD